jgi:maleylacetoacetate isomerase
MRPLLYSYYRSSASWRVRIALAYKSIDYEYRPVSLIKDGGQQLTSEYRELNPMRQVPTLVMDGVTLTQSLPIIEYLEETRPSSKSLLPKDPLKRAQARQIAEIINSGIQPLQNLAVINLVAEYTGEEAKKATWLVHWITLGLQGLERTLSQTAGKFCVGDDVTIADLCLIPQVYSATRFGVDLGPFPIISRVAAECNKLEAFKVADVSCQPDTPPDTK